MHGPVDCRDGDFVTGLATRRELEERLEQLLRPPVACAIVVVDVVGLGRTNEGRGFLAGDGVLRQAAERLREAAAGAVMLARLGGDELVAVFSGEAAEARAAETAGKLRSLESPRLRAGMTAATPIDTRESLIDRLYATLGGS